MADTENKRALPADGEPEAPKNDLTALIAHVQDRPGIYIGAIVFVLVVLAATGIYRAMQASALRTQSTEYARAIEKEDPAERSAAFAAVAQSSPQFAARALYLEGEAALDAGNYDAARAAFTKLRETHPGFEFVPDAVEGLGFIEEDSGDYATARKFYDEVAAKWPDSAAAKRQPYNLARCYEGEANLSAAIEQYRKQLEMFPGSTIAVRTQQRLDELRETNPELFADEQTVANSAPLLQELTTDPATAPIDQLELSIDRLDTDQPPADVQPSTEAPTESAPQAETPPQPESTPQESPTPPQ